MRTEFSNWQPSMESVRVDAHGLTDPGIKRKVNEDQYLIASLTRGMTVFQSSLSQNDKKKFLTDMRGMLFIVADGLGGHRAGKHASRRTVETIQQFVRSTGSWCLGLDERHEGEMVDDLARSVEKCQRDIEAQAAQSPGMRGMGTTLTMGYVLWPKMYVVHVGDSRCYLRRGTRMEQITTDHTVGARFLGKKKAPPGQVSRWSEVLWNAIGGDTAKPQPEIRKVGLRAGDVVLFCTDGLTRHVEDPVISGLLQKSRSAKSACESLRLAANRDGGSDNITAVVARFTRPGGGQKPRKRSLAQKRSAALS